MGFTYKSYSFVDKDPIIDEVRTLVQQHGATYKNIQQESGVSPATLAGWFSGSTRKPQAATLNAVARSMGWKLGFVPYNAAPLVQPTPAPPKPAVKPSERATRHVAQMAKYKRSR